MVLFLLYRKEGDGEVDGEIWRMFFLPIGPQKWPNCPVKGLWVWILGTQTPQSSAPRPKPSVGTPAGRVQDQDQDQEDEQEFVRSPKPANSCNKDEPKSAKSKRCQLYSKIRVGEIVYPIDATLVTVIGYCTDMEVTLAPNTTAANTITLVSESTKIPVMTIAPTMFTTPTEASSTPSE